MHDVFISYRVADSSYPAAAIFEHLSNRIDGALAFRDCDSLRPGDHYPTSIMDALRRSRVVVALIGRHWAGGDVPGSRRIDGERDWVRCELAHALSAPLPIVPVLLDGAPQLAAIELPDDLRPLRHATAMQLSHRHWKPHLAELVAAVARHVPVKPRDAVPTEPADASAAVGRPAGMTFHGGQIGIASTGLVINDRFNFGMGDAR